MTFLSPLWLGAAAIAVARRHPRFPPVIIDAAPASDSAFPTSAVRARQGEARASSRTTRPTDLLLLLMRCVALLLLGTAF